MVKLGAFLGYSFSSLGIGLLVITTFFVFTSAKYNYASITIYPYHTLAGPSFITGLLFLNFGILGIWINHQREKRKQDARSRYNSKNNEHKEK